jgi:hypothetical protein
MLSDGSGVVEAGSGDLVVFTWHQIAFETAMFFTAMITLTCVALLSHQGFHVIKRRRRFSLRDLLIVFTLIATAAGLMIGMSKENKEGIPRKRTSQLLREYQEYQLNKQENNSPTTH